MSGHTHGPTHGPWVFMDDAGFPAQNSGHTPGPWHVVPTPNYAREGWVEIIGPASRPVVMVDFFDRTSDDETVTHCGVRIHPANARLIAAAPELLATLERIELQLSTRTDAVICKLLTEARAAIAKAKGGAL